MMNGRVKCTMLGLLALLVSLPAAAKTLFFITPSYDNTDTIACGPDYTRPLMDLDRVTLYGSMRWAPQIRLLAQKRLFLPGVRESVSWSDSGQIWTCYVTFTDEHGNESCPSNYVTVNATTGVPPQQTQNWQVYDILGRRLGGINGVTQERAIALTRLRPPGIYLLRSAANVKLRLVVAR